MHNRNNVKEKNSKYITKHQQNELPDEIALRDEIFQLKRQMMMLKKANERNIVKVRKYEDEAKKKDRQIEQLIDPVKNGDVRKLLSTKGAALLLNLKEQNNTLIQMILDKDMQIKRLTGEIKTSKVYGSSKRTDSYRMEIERLRNLLIKSQNMIKGAQGTPQRKSICVGGTPNLDSSVPSDRSSPRDLGELQFTIRSLEAHMKYSNELIAKKNEQIIQLTDQLNLAVNASQCNKCRGILDDKYRWNSDTNSILTESGRYFSSHRDRQNAAGESAISSTGSAIGITGYHDNTKGSPRLFERHIYKQKGKEYAKARLATSAPTALICNAYHTNDIPTAEAEAAFSRDNERTAAVDNYGDRCFKPSKILGNGEEVGNNFQSVNVKETCNQDVELPDLARNKIQNGEGTRRDQNEIRKLEMDRANSSFSKEILLVPTADEYYRCDSQHPEVKQITKSNKYNRITLEDDSDEDTAEFELMEKEVENEDNSGMESPVMQQKRGENSSGEDSTSSGQLAINSTTARLSEQKHFRIIPQDGETLQHVLFREITSADFPSAEILQNSPARPGADVNDETEEYCTTRDEGISRSHEKINLPPPGSQNATVSSNIKPATCCPRDDEDVLTKGNISENWSSDMSEKSDYSTELSGGVSPNGIIKENDKRNYAKNENVEFNIHGSRTSLYSDNSLSSTAQDVITVEVQAEINPNLKAEIMDDNLTTSSENIRLPKNNSPREVTEKYEMKYRNEVDDDDDDDDVIIREKYVS